MTGLQIARRRVQAGAQLLDEAFGRGWRYKIRLRRQGVERGARTMRGVWFMVGFAVPALGLLAIYH